MILVRYLLPDLDSNGDVYERMTQKLNNHFVLRKYQRRARFRLRQNQQKSHQTLMKFYLECGELRTECQYENMEDEFLLERLIFEVKDDKLRERTMEEELNFQRFLDVLA